MVTYFSYTLSRSTTPTTASPHDTAIPDASDTPDASPSTYGVRSTTATLRVYSSPAPRVPGRSPTTSRVCRTTVSHPGTPTTPSRLPRPSNTVQQRANSYAPTPAWVLPQETAWIRSRPSVKHTASDVTRTPVITAEAWFCEERWDFVCDYIR